MGFDTQCVPVALAVLVAVVDDVVVVTGGPPPVSVAVVPVVCADCVVSVDPTELSTGFLLQARGAASTRAAATAATSDARILLCIVPPSGNDN
jgi:hypothetical protein